MTNTETYSSRINSTRIVWLVFSLVVMLIAGASFFIAQQDTSEPEVESTVISALDVLFLAPADSNPVNLFRLNVQNQAVEQITFRDEGLIEYSVSPDGEWVAYTVRITALVSDIWTTNLVTGQELQLTNCLESTASCYTPAWRYDSQQLAYTRRELDPASGWQNTDHVWILDIASRETEPLFDDLTILNRYPVWSPSENLIAMSLEDPAGVLVYDFASTQTLFMPSGERITGSFSPNGDAIIYPALRFGEVVQNYYTHLEMVILPDFETATTDQDIGIERISGDTNAAVEDGQAAFHPTQPFAAITRRYLDERFSRGYQIFLLDLNTNQVRELVFDADYTHAALGWSADGNFLLYQRADPTGNNRAIEIWLYDLDNDDARMLYTNGYMPRFLNVR